MSRREQNTVIEGIEGECLIEIKENTWSALGRGKENVSSVTVWDKEKKISVVESDYELDEKNGLIQRTKSGKLNAGDEVFVEFHYDLDVKIKEMKMRDLHSIIDELDKDLDFKKLFENKILSCTSLKFDDLLDLAPSEMEGVFKVFCEVNKTLFDVLKKAKVKELLFSRMQEDFLERMNPQAMELAKQSPG